MPDLKRQFHASNSEIILARESSRSDAFDCMFVAL